MKFRIDIQTGRGLAARLNAREKLEKVVSSTTFQVERRIKQLLSLPKSGRIYTHYFFVDKSGRLRKGKKRRKPHIASAPGEAPAVDSGFLRKSVTSQVKGLVGTVSVGANYGIFQERGTAKIKPRPYIRPVMDEIRPILFEKLEKALR